MRLNLKSAFVFDEIPDISHGGGAVTAYNILLILCQKFDKVYFIILYETNKKNISNFEKKLSSKYTNYKLIFCDLPNPAQEKVSDIFFVNRFKIFNSLKYSKKIESIIKNLNVDFLFAYHWEALAAITKFKGCPKFLLVGDPIHLPILFRGLFYSLNKSKFSLGYLVQKYIEWTRIIPMKKGMKELLNQGTITSAFAFHHTKDFNKICSNNKCVYIKTPMSDPYKSNEKKKFTKNKFKIMHIGHLAGIVTLYGLNELIKNIVPILDLKIGKENYELHIVGGNFENIEHKLKNIILKHPSIIVRGKVSPADLDFKNSDVLIVPNSITLGIRVRIITALSYGLPVVTHIANKSGIPELEDEENCLISDNSAGLADGIIKFYNNDLLKNKISINSRKTFENNFSLNSVGDFIENQIKKNIKYK